MIPVSAKISLPPDAKTTARVHRWHLAYVTLARARKVNRVSIAKVAIVDFFQYVSYSLLRSCSSDSKAGKCYGWTLHRSDFGLEDSHPCESYKQPECLYNRTVASEQGIYLVVWGGRKSQTQLRVIWTPKHRNGQRLHKTGYPLIKLPWLISCKQLEMY